jgi:hypothetical protein
MIEDIDGNRFPENHDEALEESRRFTSLNKTEFDCFLKALSKGDTSYVSFGHPREFYVVFEVYCLILHITFNLDTGLMEKTVMFRFPLKDLGLSDEEPDEDAFSH